MGRLRREHGELQKHPSFRQISDCHFFSLLWSEVNTKTGDTTLIEPREKPKAPPATAAVSSTPVVVGGGITPAALTGATTPGVSGGMTPMVTETPHNPVPSTPMRNPSTPAPVALPEGWAQITREAESEQRVLSNVHTNAEEFQRSLGCHKQSSYRIAFKQIAWI